MTDNTSIFFDIRTELIMIALEKEQLSRKLHGLLKLPMSSDRMSYAFDFNMKNILLNGEVFALRPGLRFLRLDTSVEEDFHLPLSLPDDIAFLAFNAGDPQELILPDLGRKSILEGEWAVFAGSNIQIVYQQNKKLSLFIFAVQRCLLSELLKMSDLPKDASICCFTCTSVLGPTFLQGEASQQLKLLIGTISGINPSKNASHRLMFESRCLECFAEFFKQPIMGERKGCLSFCKHRDLEALRDVADYLKKHLGESHSLNDLSRRFHLNEFKLKKGFKELYGSTVFGFLRCKRMEFAEKLLRNTDASIIEIANAVGYSNPSHFSRAFKESYSVLPGGYRKLQRMRSSEV